MPILTGVDVSVDYETLQVKISPKLGQGQPCVQPKGRILFSFHEKECSYIGVDAMILESQKSRTAVIVPVDAAGNQAQVENIQWASSDTSLLTVEPSEAGLSAVFTSVGPVGNVQLTVTGDADLGEGVTEISGTLDVQIIAGNAVAFQINVLPEVPVV